MASRKPRKTLLSIRDPSPDPIALPSSPLAPHSARSGSALPGHLIINGRFTASPSQPFLAPGNARRSPRRPSNIRDSPSKKVIRRPSASPAVSGFDSWDHNDRASYPDLESVERTNVSSGPGIRSTDDFSSGNKGRSHSKVSKARHSRLSHLQSSAATARSRRLVAAREQLDQALQEAGDPADVGSDHNSEMVGDLTLSMNEDFSIVSFNSLQTAKEASMIQTLPSISESAQTQTRPTATELSMPADPIQYPDISRAATEARSPEKQKFQIPDIFSPEARSVSRSAANSPYHPSQKQVKGVLQTQQETIDVSTLSARNSEALAPTVEAEFDDVDNVEALDEDIWQDEASRSIEEEASQSILSVAPSKIAEKPTIATEDLLVRESHHPPRSKIPKTWRRSSGISLSYVDSPTQTEADRQKRSNGSTDESHIPTPPGTDEDVSHEAGNAHEQAEAFTHSDLTEPDAEATQFHEHANLLVADHGKNTSTQGASHSSDHVDHAVPGSLQKAKAQQGLFQNGARLLEKSPIKPLHRLTRDPINHDRVASGHMSTLKDGDADSRSLKRKRLDQENDQRSGAEDRPRPTGPSILSPSRHAVHTNQPLSRVQLTQGTDVAMSIEKANVISRPDNAPKTMSSIQETLSHAGSTTREGYFQRKARRELERQQRLAAERAQKDAIQSQTKPPPARDSAMVTVKQPAFRNSTDLKPVTAGSGALARLDFTKRSQAAQDDHSVSHDVDVSQSYEEYLNKDSPQKVCINFNDSEEIAAPVFRTKRYPSLFDQPAAPPPIRTVPIPVARPSSAVDSAPNMTEDLSAAQDPNPMDGIFSRIRSQLLSLVTGPTGPSELLPSRITTAANSFPSSLRAQLRNRYGVITETYPWTMCHMRTLHRMLNSVNSRSGDTIIPHRGPMAPYLSYLIGTAQTSVTGHPFIFTTDQAHVVFSFFQLMVPPALISAMQRGEVEYLGDSVAKQFRGHFAGDSRHGDDAVWTAEQIAKGGAHTLVNGKGKLTMNFVVRALGDAVLSGERRGTRHGSV